MISKNSEEQSSMQPEKSLEICNAINAAIAAGKIVTLDTLTVSTQIGGAVPGFSLRTEPHCILNDLVSRDTVIVMSIEGCIIRAYFPKETTVDIIYDSCPAHG